MRTYDGSVGPLADSIIETVRASNGFVIELGVHTGEGSTAMIQEGLEGHDSPLHVSVDWQDIIHPEHRPTVPWWHLVLGDTRSQSTWASAMDHARTFHAEFGSGVRVPGVIFIDTDHNYDQMTAELLLWCGSYTPETVILMHDTWMFGPENVEMNRAIKEYAARWGWTYDDYRTDSHGLGRMRRLQL